MIKRNKQKNALLRIIPITLSKRSKISTFGQPCYDPTVYVSHNNVKKRIKNH